MTDPEPDEDLVRRYLAGETAAFSILVERHQTRLYNLALRMMGNPEDAHDATQDAFLSALRRLHQYRGDAAFSTWMHRVTVNACYDLLRKRRRQPALHLILDEHDRAPEPGPPVPDHADATAGSMDAGAALQTIPEEFRLAVVLADVQDLPYDEIARILDVPVGTVKSRVHRGRLALAAAMGLGGGARSDRRDDAGGEPATAAEPSERES